MQRIFISTITNANLIGICIASFLIISLGYIFVKNGMLKSNWINAFSKIVLEVSLPRHSY